MKRRYTVTKHIGVRTHRYKLMYFYEKGEMGDYDFQKDKTEMNNIYGNAKYAEVVHNLK